MAVERRWRVIDVDNLVGCDDYDYEGVSDMDKNKMVDVSLPSHSQSTPDYSIQK